MPKGPRSLAVVVSVARPCDARIRFVSSGAATVREVLVFAAAPAERPRRPR
jgi:hypothetical protein